MTRQDYSIAATEVLQLLPYFEQSEVGKIPEKFMSFLNSYQDEKYIRYFDTNKPLKELDMSRSTKILLGLIYRNYWCSDEMRNEYDQMLEENEEKYQKALKEKYSNDVFGNNKEEKKEADENIVIDDSSLDDNIENEGNTFENVVNEEDENKKEPFTYNVVKHQKVELSEIKFESSKDNTETTEEAQTTETVDTAQNDEENPVVSTITISESGTINELDDVLENFDDIDEDMDFKEEVISIEPEETKEAVETETVNSQEVIEESNEDTDPLDDFDDKKIAKVSLFAKLKAKIMNFFKKEK